MEIAERYLAVCGDGLVNTVSVLYHAFIHTADTPSHIRLAVQRSLCIVVCEVSYFLSNRSCLALRDKLGGLDTIDHQPQFVRLELGIFQPIPTRTFIDVSIELNIKFHRAFQHIKVAV